MGWMFLLPWWRRAQWVIEGEESKITDAKITCEGARSASRSECKEVMIVLANYEDKTEGKGSVVFVVSDGLEIRIPSDTTED
ncbi:MAG: hypothetical protein Q9210_006101 [Variospora velana]